MPVCTLTLYSAHLAAVKCAPRYIFGVINCCVIATGGMTIVLMCCNLTPSPPPPHPQHSTQYVAMASHHYVSRSGSLQVMPGVTCMLVDDALHALTLIVVVCLTVAQARVSRLLERRRRVHAGRGVLPPPGPHLALRRGCSAASVLPGSILAVQGDGQNHLTRGRTTLSRSVANI